MLPLLAQFRTETCPYCFERFRLPEAPFRCTSPPARCKPEVDEVRKRVWDDPVPRGRVLAAESRFAGEQRCPQCEQVSRKRLCPHCHMELPHTFGRFRNLILAVIGAKEAGKSHYLAVLIHQIRKEVGPSLEMFLEPLDDHTIRRYRDEFYRPVYERGRVIDATRSALVDRRVQMPLVYSLTFSGKDLLGRRRIRGAVTLVFFDTAGEDLDDADVLATVNKYIYRSDGLILLLDPLQLRRVRDRLNGTPLPQRNTETTEIIARTTNLVLAGRRLAPDAMVPTPLAVAFSKFDAVEELVDPQFQLLADSDHGGGFDVEDFTAVDAEMRALVEEWCDHPLVHQVTTRYRTSGFFGLSALGCNPHGDRQIPRVVPRRAEDPFLWLLHHHKLIPTRRRSGRRFFS